ncbi:stage 0 sporulation protein, partial [Planococcus sp. SIMBA_143]
MYEVVGVRFKKAGKIYYFDPSSLQVSDKEFVIVETARGVEFGKVVLANNQVDEEDIVLPLKKVIRIADEKDRLAVEDNKHAAEEAFDVCVSKIEEYKLDMKL